MKNLKNQIIEALGPLVPLSMLAGAIYGLTHLVTPKLPETTYDLPTDKGLVEAVFEARLQNKKNEYPISWYLVDSDGDGEHDQLVTPHRNNYYGTKGPVYSKENFSFEGKDIFESAKKLAKYKEEFSRIEGFEEVPYWFCKIDDFNNDSIADKISWPRLPSERAPSIGGCKGSPYVLPKSLQAKADSALALEMKIQDYLHK